jgi:hypothetical protein
MLASLIQLHSIPSALQHTVLCFDHTRHGETEMTVEVATFCHVRREQPRFPHLRMYLWGLEASTPGLPSEDVRAVQFHSGRSLTVVGWQAWISHVSESVICGHIVITL